MENYRYSPLDTRTSSCRLLRLRSGDSITIECDIFHATLTDPGLVSYEALSYAWGSTELVYHIKIDGQRLWITENLHAALVCLRSPDHDRILWIDAICIDQLNKVEQSQQVRGMGRIFGSASRVIFWLGMPTQEVMLLMNALGALESKIIVTSRGGMQADGTIWKTLWHSLQPPDSDLLFQQRRGLQVLLKRPWFDRVWILQEVYNASSAVVCTGFLSVSAIIFALAPYFLDEYSSQHVQSVLDMMLEPVGGISPQQRAKDNLIDLLGKFHGCKATDPRDMIFALLGMSSDSSEHELLRPDYTKPLFKVIRDTIRYWIGFTSIPIHQILNFLTDFRIVRVTYLIPPAYSTMETLHIPLSSDTLQCVRNASLFLVEPHAENSTEQRDLVHIELDEKQSTLNVHGRGLRVIPWSTDRQNVKLLVVMELKKALSLLALHKCKQIFNFVADKSLHNRPSLRDELLIGSAEKGSLDMMKLLLDNGADVNAQGRYGSALQTALINRHKKVVKLLLDNGADVNWRRRDYGTALHIASGNGYEEIVQMLLDRGAHVNAQTSQCNALQRASENGHEEVVRILLDGGADINAQGQYGDALQHASQYGHEKVVQLLLDRGADVNAEGGIYGNALQAALALGHGEVVKLLSRYGAK